MIEPWHRHLQTGSIKALDSSKAIQLNAANVFDGWNIYHVFVDFKVPYSYSKHVQSFFFDDVLRPKNRKKHRTAFSSLGHYQHPNNENYSAVAPKLLQKSHMEFWCFSLSWLLLGFSMLSWCLPSDLGAVSATLVLSFSCFRPCLPACLPSVLGYCVCLPGLVFLFSLVLSPSLSLRLCLVLFSTSFVCFPLLSAFSILCF